MIFSQPALTRILYLGVKPGGFSVSIDERDNGGSFKPLIDFFINGPKGRDQVLYALRDVMSNANTFDEATNFHIINSKNIF